MRRSMYIFKVRGNSKIFSGGFVEKNRPFYRGRFTANVKILTFELLEKRIFFTLNSFTIP